MEKKWKQNGDGNRKKGLMHCFSIGKGNKLETIGNINIEKPKTYILSCGKNTGN